MKPEHENARLVRFGDHAIGDGRPTFVTMEAGPTHDGVESALRLIDIAAAAEADAIKFQIVDPDRLVADRTMPFTYSVLVDRESGATEEVTEPLYNILCRRALSGAEWKAVKTHADSYGLAFFATVAFDDELSLLETLGCDSVKIASGDVNHLPLIRRAARTGMCLQLDTGNATLGEIEQAVDVARAEGNEHIIIHQCPSGYPARLESINLNIIPTLRRLFPFPVAFSDHTPGWDMDIAAVSMGANLVEKTITEDRMTRSVEHIFSIEKPDAQRFVSAIRELEVAMGSPRRILHASERQSRLAIRRSTWLVRDARGGERVRDLAVEFRRPAFEGIAPDIFETLGERHLRCDLAAGHQLVLADLD